MGDEPQTPTSEPDAQGQQATGEPSGNFSEPDSSGTAAGLLDRLEARGIPRSTFASEDEALDAFLQIADELEKNRHYIDLGRRYESEQAKSGDTASKEKQAAEGSQWDAPPYDPTWETYRDANGQFRRDAPYEAVVGLPKAEMHARKVAFQLARDPSGFLSQFIPQDKFAERERLEELSKKLEEIDQWRRGLESQNELQTWEATNRDLLYEIDSKTGAASLTPLGENIAATFEAMRAGGADIAMMRKAGEAMIARHKASSKSDGRTSETSRSRGEPSGGNNRGGSENTRESFFRQALEDQEPANRDATVPDGKNHNRPSRRKYKTAREVADEVLRERGLMPAE